MFKTNSTVHDNNYILSEGSYTAQYPILRIAQNTLHFISLADLFN